jgi:hypothetical protein
MLVGPTLSYEGMLQIGLMGGIENAPQGLPARGSAFFSFTLPIADFTSVVEYGVTGFWHQELLRFGGVVDRKSPAGHVGFISRRYFGEGFYLDCDIPWVLMYLAVVEGFEDRAVAHGNYGDFFRGEVGITIKTND